MLKRIVSRAGRSAAIGGIAAITIAGCQTTDMPSTDRPSVSFQDNCAQLRRPFEEIRAQRDSIIGQNVAAGAVAGAFIGILAGNDPEDVLAGAVLGGLSGAAAAYAKNAQSRGATQASLRRFVDRDARNEAAQNDRLVRTIIQMNECRLDQADRVVAQARSGELGIQEADALLDEIRRATREDNRAIQRVAGFGRTYNAYVGVLDREDVAAARRTQRAVAEYQPQVRRVSRNAGGGAAIAVSPPSRAPTPVARAEQSRQLMQATAQQSNATLEAELQARQDRLDELTQINAI
ncbi:hypothetical protein [Rhodosalinus sediminis]|uniref:hypothetical protein n=1 Tax=Rhodosalinus sediminis TaxID=1940533 RepID=UPI0023578A7C|nr:hypothetical protein [Rhodosalinus sediminis]